MTSHIRGLCLAVTLGVTWGVLAAPACAQDNYDQGKSAQQLFATDCTFCHKSPQGLAAKAGSGLSGLDGFLREHYTVSRQSASMLAKYLQSVGDAPAADARRGGSRRAAKPSDKKTDEKKPEEKKPDETRKSDSKPESKPEAKAEAKPEAKPEQKPEAKSETKPEAKSESKPESEKPAKPE